MNEKMCKCGKRLPLITLPGGGEVTPDVCSACAEDREIAAKKQARRDALDVLISRSKIPKAKLEEALRDTPALHPATKALLTGAAPGQGAWFWGEPGTGKTTQLLLLGFYLMLEHLKNPPLPEEPLAGAPKVFYLDESELFTVIREDGWDATPYHGADLLLLDQAGDWSSGNWREEVFRTLLNKRYVHRKMTVWASNHHPQRLHLNKGHGVYDEANAQRILELIGQNRFVVHLKTSWRAMRIAGGAR